jgi:acyl-coenzyme A synthetase/AMP-(fatty) acid ligase
MKIIRNNQLCDISDQVKQFKQRLKEQKVFTLSSSDHTDHIAAYIAWKEVGGNILIKNPHMPKDISEFVDQKILDFEYENSAIFLTSGTTGYPKLIVDTNKQFESLIKLTTDLMNWDSDSKWLNVTPAFTSSFWHIVVPCLVEYDGSIVLSSRESVLEDLNQDVNLSIFVPGMIDNLRILKVPVDLSKMNTIISGASAVLKRHVEFLFERGLNRFTQLYGATETMTPFLSRTTIEPDEFCEYLEFKPLNKETEIKLVDGELWVKGSTICENFKQLDYSEGWLRTGDLWEQTNDLIKFVGRKNDIVKVNGFQANLLMIESVSEDRTDLGETLAVVRSSFGTQWIELFYTNKKCQIDKNKFKEIFEPILYKCCIPKRYTYINRIPRNATGKKVRTAPFPT